MYTKIVFTKTRKVKTPFRAHKGDAGIDFFFPEDLTYDDLLKANHNAEGIGIVRTPVLPVKSVSMVYVNVNGYDIVEAIELAPHTRILIPSGIRVFLSPEASMLRADNKSGVAVNTGLIVGADIVDSPYTGEMGIHVINTSNKSVVLRAGNKVVQFIHTPVYLSELDEISNDTYDKLAKDWGTRGDNGFGSGHSDIDYSDHVGEVINSNGETSN